MKESSIHGISPQAIGAEPEPACAARHRGPHPSDHGLFAGPHLPVLGIAVSELSWLLSRDYAVASALKLVGDRHALTQRQRLAIGRAACADAQKESREARRVRVEHVRGKSLAIDGFNLVITLEAALGGGVLLHCRDGCLRDMSSVHGSYRAVEETDRALDLIGTGLATLAPSRVTWFLDQPVSNSGRLADRIRQVAIARGCRWTAEVVMNPDPVLSEMEGSIVVSSDSLVIDRCRRWTNLAAWLVHKEIPEAAIVALTDD